MARRPDQPKRVVAYGRRSHFDAKSKAPELQEQMCRDWCRQQGHEMVGWYLDHGISGTTDERPALQEMLRYLDANRRQVDILLVPWLDRLCRDEGFYYREIAPFTKHGVQLVALDMPESQDPLTGPLFLGMMLLFAAFFARQAGQRQRRYNLQRAVAGQWPGGVPAYGFAWDGERLVEDPETGPVARRIWEALAAGESYREIARSLNRQGVPTARRNGSRWHAGTIRQMLGATMYRGQIGYAGERFDSDRVASPIPTATLRAALARRTDSRPAYRTADHEPRVLSGLLRCGDCGRSSLVRGTSRNRDRTREYPGWRCYGCRVGACDARWIAERRLEAVLAGAVAEGLAARGSRVVAAAPAPPAADHRRTLARLQARREREVNLYRAGVTDLAAMQAELAKLDATMAELQAPPPPPPAVDLALVERHAALLADPGRWLAVAEPDRRRLYRAAITRAVVTTRPALAVAVELTF